MRWQSSKPNRFKYGVLTVMEFAPLCALTGKGRKDSKVNVKTQAAIEKCLNCPLEACDEKICRRK